MYNWIKNQQGKITWQMFIVVMVVLILGTSLGWWFVNDKNYDDKKEEGAVMKVIQPDDYQKSLIITVLDQVLNITPVNAMGGEKTVLADGVIKYFEAYPGTDVEQIKYSNKLKESLILKSANHPDSFEYKIDTQNFNWEFDGEGNIIISSKDEIVESMLSSDGDDISAERMKQYSKERSKFFKIPKPYMVETPTQSSPYQGGDKGGVDVGEVRAEIVGDRLILTLDKEWIKNHQYPILVDPTVEKMPRMIQELSEKRSYNSMTFLNDDGSYTTMAHVGHINYRDENGEYQLADTTLQKTDNGWVQEKASYKSVFPKYADEWIEFENTYEGGGTSFMMKPIAEHVGGRLVTDSSDIWHDKKVIYKDAFGAANDLELMAGNVGMFKYIKLNQRPNDLSRDLEIPFELKLNSGEKLIINGEEWDGSEEIITSEEIGIIKLGSRASFLRKFTVWDNKGSVEDIKVKISNQNGKIYFTKILPKDFLETAEYPVYTDSSGSYYLSDGQGGDGFLSYSVWSWSEARSAATATGGQTTAADNARAGASQDTGEDRYTINRAFIPTDTSGLPDTASVSAATLYVYFIEKINTDNDGYDYINVLQSTQASSTSLVAADYDAIGTTEGSTDTDLGTIGTSGYTTFSLNATGIGWIDLTGYTELGLREGHDLDNHTITNDTADYLRGYTSEQSGTSADPYLSITYNVTGSITTVTDTPDPTNPGRSVSFIVDWSDTDTGDMVKIKICKTNSLTSQNCDDGYWASSTAFTLNDPAVVTYDVVAGDAGQTRDYWAFVCDNNAGCTTGTSGTFSVNAQSVIPNIKVRGGLKVR
ncbi:MAG TPA: hypothetical protein PLF15_03345 [bacterium]|nr:hypothetical protein [bacterium]